MNCTCCNQTGTNGCGCSNAADYCSCADQGVAASFTRCGCRCCPEGSTGGEGTGGEGTSCCRRRCCSCGC